MPNDYYKIRESVEEYVHLAKDVSGSALIEKLSDFLAGGSSLLELGSGPGTDWEILSKSYEVVGSDNSNEFLSHLKKRHPGGKFIELDASKLETGDIFQGIYSNKVLHHLRDHELENSIQRQSQRLKGEGIVCHSFWKGKGSEIFKGLFVNYHTEKALRDFFEPQFEILLLESYAEFEDNDSVLLIAKKKK